MAAGFVPYCSRILPSRQHARLVRNNTPAIQTAWCATPFTITSTELCTSSSRSAIQPTDANPAKSAPPILTDGYARVRLMRTRDGMLAATTISCIVSIPKLNARMPATRSQRPSPNSPRVAANAQTVDKAEKGRYSGLFSREKRAKSVNRRHQNRDGNQDFNGTAGHADESQCREHQRDRMPESECRHNSENAEQTAAPAGKSGPREPEARRGAGRRSASKKRR